MSIRILLIDDHPLFRKGVAQLVRADDELELAGEASDGDSGITLAAEVDPDLILIDLNMKLMNGIETLRRLKAAGVRARCVMLTVSDDERDVLDAMKAGADGYLLKDMEPEELCLRIKQSVRGAVRSNKEIARVLGISDATVKVHIKHVLRKLNMKSRLEAAVWALQNPQFRQTMASG
jgi:two-component system, NarL family, nitrate/nitrite response regulator NarL